MALASANAFVPSSKMINFIDATTRISSLALSAVLTTTALLHGCASTGASWHDDTLSTQQLATADCKALAADEAKLAENERHMADKASGTEWAAYGILVLEMLAAVQTKDTNPKADAALATGDVATQAKAKASEVNSRLQAVRALMTQRGC